MRWHESKMKQSKEILARNLNRSSHFIYRYARSLDSPIMFGIKRKMLSVFNKLSNGPTGWVAAAAAAVFLFMIEISERNQNRVLTLCFNNDLFEKIHRLMLQYLINERRSSLAKGQHRATVFTSFPTEVKLGKRFLAYNSKHRSWSTLGKSSRLWNSGCKAGFTEWINAGTWRENKPSWRDD